MSDWRRVCAQVWQAHVGEGGPRPSHAVDGLKDLNGRRSLDAMLLQHRAYERSRSARVQHRLNSRWSGPMSRLIRVE